MSLRLLIDMNLSPQWVAELAPHGYDAVHWSTVGDARASDAAVMAWARDNGRIVFTHDLDFGTILALTHANGPSVLQVRGQDVLPERMVPFVGLLTPLAGSPTSHRNATHGLLALPRGRRRHRPPLRAATSRRNAAQSRLQKRA